MKEIFKLYSLIPLRMKGFLTGTYLLCFMLTLGGYIEPIIFGLIIDNMNNHSLMTYFIIYSSITLSIIAGEYLLQYLKSSLWYMNNTFFGVKGFEKIMKTKIIDNPDKEADMLSDFAMYKLRRVYQDRTVDFFVNAVLLVIFSVYIIYKSYLTGILVLISGIISFFSYKYKSAISKKYNKVFYEKESKTIAIISDTIKGYGEIRVMKSLDLQIKYIKSILCELNGIRKKWLMEEFKNILFLDTFNKILYPLALGIAGYQIYSGRIKIGEGIGLIQLLTIYSSYSTYFISIIPEISKISQDIKIYLEKYNCIEQIKGEQYEKTY